MKDLRSVRRLIKLRQRRAISARLARITGEAKSGSAATLPAHTRSGLPIEDQVRKAWAPIGAGLPTF